MIDDSEPNIVGYDAQIAASQALLSHVYWVCDDLAARIESFNQRAGVILAASVAIVVVGLQSLLPSGVWLLTLTLCPPWALAICAALYTLNVTSSHSIGPAAIRSYVGQPFGPDLSRGHWMARELLNSLTSPAGDQPSVLEGLNLQCTQKASALRVTQVAFVLALVASLASGAKWTLLNAAAN